MSRQARDNISTAILLTALSWASCNSAALAEAGMGAQTAAQSSAASSAGSKAAASTVSPATTPSSSAGVSPGLAAPSGLSSPSLLPNSSSTSVTAPTAPNGPAVSAPVSAGDNSNNNLGGPSTSASSNQSSGALRAGAASASGGGAGGTASQSNAAQGTSSAQLRGVIGAPTDASTGKLDDSVASFFQINAAKTGPGYGLIKSSTTSTSGSAPGATHSALWHIMDNLGVPVPTGNNTEALDPSLRRNYVNPELPNINNYKTRSGKTQTLTRGYEAPPTASTQTPAATAINMQKIPESELEGVDYSAKNDDQNKQR